MIAIDTAVLVDLLADGPGADAAEATLRQAMAAGPVVACEVVLAEVIAALGHSDVVVEALDEAGIRFSALEQRSAVRAGEMQRRWAERQRAAGPAGAAPRALSEFLVGAHALLQCQGLITRETAFHRDYFKGLRLIVPQA